mgnify:CR=1 FL=1
MEFKISSSVSQIPPSSLFNDGFELSDQTIIPSENIAGAFSPEVNKVELFIYDTNTSLLDSAYDYNDWTITQNSNTTGLGDTDTLQIDPSNDLIKRGYDIGNLYAVYNFINYELSSSPTDLLYISEISSDRTEIKLNSNFISNEDLETSFNILKSKIDDVDYFDEFYIAFQGNNYNIGVNLLLDTSLEQYSILIKLYDALPSEFSLKDEIYVATKVAETQAYEVKFFNDSNLEVDAIPYLRGPNYNLEIKDFVNNSTELKNKSELLDAVTTGSNNNLQNILNQKGVKITPNYSFSTFNEFVNFSSAKKRIENFYEKVSQIQSYEDDISTIKSSITGTTLNTPQVSSSLASANNNIENIIKNFDGYEYHLFYTSGPSAYPKVADSYFPHPLLNTGSTEVLQWLGSDIEGSSTYGGIILSASLYDNNNQNWLYYTIPEFIRDNQDNDNYIDFSNMAGQHFDEIWLYTKAVTEKNNTTNELDKGIPLKLSQDAIKSLGYEGFGNNFNDQNNYMGLIGEEDGSFIPSTGNEVIDNYIAINNGTVVNYWSPSYSFLFYVEQLGEKGFPYPIDKVSKEIYKRLYHNMAYLVKKKGTISGLRQLINIWGIPDTILRINEFGGKNKDNTDDYDYWYNRYSYAFSPVANQNVASASAIIPWMPLERNRVNDSKYIVPDNFQFRFKTTGYPSSSQAGEFFSQSLAVKKSDGDETSTNFDLGVGLFYTGSAVGTYSGSNDTTYKDWGLVRFYISGSPSEGGTVVSNDIYLPVYDGGWWSVMLQRDTHPSASINNTNTTYTLYVKNKNYNGADGNQISFEGSASISINGSTHPSINESWNKFGTGSHDGVYLGGLVSGSNVGPHTLNPSGKMFSGSFQEFRYYSNAIPETVFNDFVMNPESIEGNNITGLESSFDIVNFRAPLGNELEDKFETSISSSHTESFTSFHPAVSAKSNLLITGSFVNPDGNVTSSNYHIQYYDNATIRTFSQPNTEIYFLDQPSIGIRNRISNKIEIDDADDFGTVLSNQISIEQDYEINRSYTEDNTSLEVAFSPQDNVNDDIIQAFGYGIISDALADPRFTSSSNDYYPKLRESAEYFFQKYTEGNIYDYIRLIKYVDNSLFKAIKAYVPARTSVSTGIIIKQHMLERNRFSPPSITNKTTVAVYPKNPFNTPLVFKNLELTSSLNIGEFKGEAGGVVNQFNYTGSPSFGETPIIQSYDNTFDTTLGLQTIVEDTQKEFYDGEYSGSKAIATTQDLFTNPFKTQPEDLGFVNFSSSSISLDPTFRNIVTNLDDITSQGIFEIIGDKIKINSPTPTKLKLTFRSTSGLISGGYDDFDSSSGLAIFIKVESTTRGIISDPGGVGYFQILKKTPETQGCFVDTPIFEVDPYETLTISYSSSQTVSGVNETQIKLRPIVKWGSQTLETSPPISQGSFSCEVPSIDYQMKRVNQFLYPLFEILSNNINSSTANRAVSLVGSIFAGGNFTLKKSQTNDVMYLILNEGESNLEGAYVSFNLNISDIKENLFSPTSYVDGEYVIRIDTIERGIILTEKVKIDNFPFSHKTSKVFIGNNESLNIGITWVLDNGIPPYSSLNGRDYYGFGVNIDSFEAFSPIWDNSDYNALNNNFNLNRPNSFLQDVDYSTNAITPVNMGLIKAGSAVKANTPDSNYTMRRVTRPRYEGSRLQSADYNFFTPGDVSFGNTSVVDSHPIYMAHFKSSKENYELWDSYTFNVDALIELPFEDITGEEETTSIPSIIKIDGSNDNLFEVSKVFDQGRKALISYDSFTSESINLDSLSVGSNQIYQGGLEYNLINGSELNKTQYDNIQTYNTASWCQVYKLPSNTLSDTYTLTSWIPTGGGVPSNHFTIYMLTSSYDVPSGFSLGNYTDGDESGNLYGGNMGEIILRGAPINISHSIDTFLSSDSAEISIVGSSLALFNTINTRIAKGKKLFPYGTSTLISSGGPYERTYRYDGISLGFAPEIISSLNINDITNYTSFNTTSSLNELYEGFNKSFQIQKGDELRVTYNFSSTDVPIWKVQDFTVLATGDCQDPILDNQALIATKSKLSRPNSLSGASADPLGTDTLYVQNKLFFGAGVAGSNISQIRNKYDSLIVTPNPKTLPSKIPEGKIYNFSIRRRVEAGDRVIVFQSPPLNSEGAKTPTGPGFLLPNDLTPQQKRNALTLISQLKGTNTFD